MIQLADDLTDPLPIEQVRMKGYLLLIKFTCPYNQTAILFYPC